jgi:hypothetical protein
MMIKQLLFLLLLVVFWGSAASAGYFEFTEPEFEEKVLTEQIENGESILININTVAVDQLGNVYYLKSDRERILDEGETYTYEEMQEIEYSVKIAAINLSGEESVFAEARFPLTTTVAGIFYAGGNRRLLVFLKTLTLVEDCNFVDASLSRERETGKSPSKSSLSPFRDQETGAWEWSGLENCFFHKLSIIEITGFGNISPF